MCEGWIADNFQLEKTAVVVGAKTLNELILCFIYSKLSPPDFFVDHFLVNNNQVIKSWHGLSWKHCWASLTSTTLEWSVGLGAH